MSPPATISRVFGLDGRAVIDRWLRFAPTVQARYDRDNGRQRGAELRSVIVVGLLFYNVYSLTGLLLMPDVAALGIALRLGVFTPLMAGLAWLVGHARPNWNERLIFIGSLGAQAFPVWQFWLTQDPLGVLTFGELFLCIVYANMLLALRFPYACAFNAFALIITLLALLTKPGLPPVVGLALSIQIATACAFAIWANHRLERRRCDDYTRALEARLEAEEADTARHTFEVLSRTDALTGLPNRRHLSETLEDWWAAPGELALLMIDIDHFKPYNDRLGHPVGDECLRHVADVLAAAGRDADAFCARFGGEEFTVLARVRGRADAGTLSQTLVEAVRTAMIPHPARPDGVAVVTVSVGVAMRRAAGAALPGVLFAHADRALYAAKRRGRNGFALCEASAKLRRAG